MTSKREAQLRDRVHALVVDAAGADIEVLEVALRGQPPRRVVRVVADTVDPDPQEGLDVDAIARLSRRIGERLDTEDAVPGSYTLEVTSPGADRPLHTSRDFARNVGRKVVIVVVDEAVVDGVADTSTEISGTLVAAEADAVVVRTDTDERRIALADVDHGRVVLPW